jgi:DNA-binding LytR/AlgR family response regulator
MIAFTYGGTPLRILLNAVANVLPVVVLGFAVRLGLRRFVIARPPVIQVVAHLTLAILFSVLWFWLLMVLLGALSGGNAVEFTVRPFPGPAAAWQLFQGLAIYVALALTVHAEAIAERAPAAGVAAPEPVDPASRLFVRVDDEIRPLDTSRIILVRGADDYSEVVTAAGTHLVRLTLAALEKRLGDRFIRAHRSLIVNADRIDRAEPAGGGRMLLRLENGETVTTSRTGARVLRERII